MKVRFQTPFLSLSPTSRERRAPACPAIASSCKAASQRRTASTYLMILPPSLTLVSHWPCMAENGPSEHSRAPTRCIPRCIRDVPRYLSPPPVVGDEAAEHPASDTGSSVQSSNNGPEVVVGAGGCQVVSTTPTGGPKQSATRRCGERSRKPAFPFLQRRRDRTDTPASIFHGFPFSLAVSVGTHNTHPSSRPPDHRSERESAREDLLIGTSPSRGG